MIEAVADRLEGAPRQLRRRWSDEFKARAVAEALESGASVSAIAHRLGIHPSQLFGWRRAVLDARKVSTEPARREVVAAYAGEAVIEVVIGEVIVRARADVSEAHLQRVIRAVRSA
ncbi:transposase [Sinorhizobium terangae]|uniref:transposase n=1 Tax=Sinorhizobium terangae TaxID=110322 RepID=UPI00178FA85A|nr:transposase [Sinorhizobium terangae]MBB4184790.1 transposase [Sinorhizobium terangae]